MRPVPTEEHEIAVLAFGNKNRVDANQVGEVRRKQNANDHGGHLIDCDGPWNP